LRDSYFEKAAAIDELIVDPLSKIAQELDLQASQLHSRAAAQGVSGEGLGDPVKAASPARSRLNQAVALTH
jgi:hypothetical protein